VAVRALDLGWRSVIPQSRTVCHPIATRSVGSAMCRSVNRTDKEHIDSCRHFPGHYVIFEHVDYLLGYCDAQQGEGS
jgi:hypothetical protein